MKRKTKSYSVDFRQEAVRRMAQAKTIAGLAKEAAIRRKLLYRWRHQLEAKSEKIWHDLTLHNPSGLG